MADPVTVTFFAVVGAATGSFAAVVADRVPRGETLGGRSKCVCGRQLRAAENIPLLAWPVLRGRARCCNARLPIGWWLWELAGAVAGITAAVTLPFTAAYIATSVTVPAAAWVTAKLRRTR